MKDPSAGTIPLEATPNASLPLRVCVRSETETGRTKERKLDIDHPRCVIGTEESCDIVVLDRAVSRKHVELTFNDSGVLVRDLDSRNGTLFLDQRVKEITISPGTTIVIGHTRVTIDVDPTEYANVPLSDARSYEELLGRSAPMQRLYSLLSRLERTLLPVLVDGESGVGKELVARAVHARSSVRQGPFIAINCGAFERSLVSSELFGHRRGAFTGATDRRDGAFVSANGGTLFLDEVGELPLDIQPLLLRVLETGEVRAIGADRPESVSVRVIAATNRNLEDEATAGRFREDLFYRLAVIRLPVPPLRARIEDIPDLVQRFATDLGAEVPKDVVQRLCGRRWPGNVRELKNAVQAYVALGVLPSASRKLESALDTALHELADSDVPYAELKEDLVERFTRAYLGALLARCGGNRSEAARRAGIDRSYINRLLAKHGDESH